MLIRADREDRRPAQAASGLVTAATLEAAITGVDPTDSWYVGTVLAIGPTVGRVDGRALVQRELRALEDCKYVHHSELTRIRHLVEDLPDECPDPVRVGDRVTFAWSAGHALTIGADRYLVLRAAEVLAVLEESVA